MTAAIELERVCKTYRSPFLRREVPALSDVSLRVDAGEAFGFVGPNGAGKSTAIKILVGSIFPSSGSARIHGVDCTAPESRRGLGYVPENPLLYDYLTPIELLGFGCSIHRVTAGDTKKHCMQWLDRFGLANAASRRIRTFSKGMAQRTALAYAMAISPRLLILDEPLSGLDPVGRRDVVEILRDYRANGGTVFFSSHVLFDVERLADRFCLIHKGEIRTIQSPADLVSAGARVLVRTIGRSQVCGMTAEPGGRWYAEVPYENVWALLDAARIAGHSIVEIKPGMNLESVFVGLLSGEAC